MKRDTWRIFVHVGHTPAEDCGEGARRGRNHYGCDGPHAIDFAMRYVIVICAITFFLIWDGLYHQGQYLDTTVREMTRVVRYITGMG